MNEYSSEQNSTRAEVIRNRSKQILKILAKKKKNQLGSITYCIQDQNLRYDEKQTTKKKTETETKKN